ncbi:hypothetical protein BH11MYX4_BH11MYX4_33750 [soil metagenome]
MKDDEREPGATSDGLELSDEEIAEAEAAVTLATLPEGDRMPAHVRERVEFRGRAFVGELAKAHARTRAARNMQSTTGAGSQVVETAEAPVAPRATSLFGWSGWAFAAAATAALFVSLSRGGSASTTAGAPRPAEDRVRLSGADRSAGELRYDRASGSGTLTLSGLPKLDAERESLELWIRFDGDSAPRPIALVDASSATLALGEGKRLCQGDPATARSTQGSPCVAIRDVLLTREDKRGSLVFREVNVVLRAAGASP